MSSVALVNHQKKTAHVNIFWDIDACCPGWQLKLDWAERLLLQQVALAKLILLMYLSSVLNWVQHFFRTSCLPQLYTYLNIYIYIYIDSLYI